MHKDMTEGEVLVDRWRYGKVPDLGKESFETLIMVVRVLNKEFIDNGKGWPADPETDLRELVLDEIDKRIAWIV